MNVSLHYHLVLLNDAMTENNVNDTISCQYCNSGHFIEYTKNWLRKICLWYICN